MVFVAVCPPPAAGKSWRAVAEKVVFAWRFKSSYAQIQISPEKESGFCQNLPAGAIFFYAFTCLAFYAQRKRLFPFRPGRFRQNHA